MMKFYPDEDALIFAPRLASADTIGTIGSRSARASLAACAALLVLVTTLEARADCTKDTECKGSRICDKGRCVEPAPPVSPCKVDRDCAGDLVCDEQRCVSAGKAAPTVATPMPAAPVPASVERPEAVKVPVHFAGSDATSYSISVGGQACQSPCDLKLSPGPTELVVGAPGEFSRMVSVPPRGGTVTLRHSHGRNIPGWSLVGLGGAALIGGTVWQVATRPSATDCVNMGQPVDCNPLNTGAIAVMGVAGAAMVAGVIVVMTDGKDDAAVAPVARSEPVRFADLQVRPSIGGGALTARFRF